MPEGRFLNDITLLEPIAAVRARPATYVGDPTSADVVCNVVSEALCLAVDTHTGGPAKQVEVRVISNDVFEVVNDGAGLPLGRHRNEDVSFIEVIMTRLYACRDEKNEAANKRWCGAGIAVLNALSRWCEVTVHRDGGRWHQRYEFGAPVHGLQRIGECVDTGNTLRFELDRSVLSGALELTRFEKNLAVFNADVPCTRATLVDLRKTDT